MDGDRLEHPDQPVRRYLGDRASHLERDRVGSARGLARFFRGRPDLVEEVDHELARVGLRECAALARLRQEQVEEPLEEPLGLGAALGRGEVECRLDALGIDVADLIPVAERLGITLDELATRILDTADASEDMNAEIVEATSNHKQLRAVLDAVNDGLSAREKRLREERREWERQIDIVARSARGLIDFADALGIVEDDAADTLRAVTNLAEGIGRIKTDPIGGGLQALGGLAQLGEAIFGESPADRALREAQEELAIEMERLRGSVERLVETLAGLTGRQIAGFEQLFADVRFRDERDPRSRIQLPTVENLDEFGLTIADIEALAGELPVEELIDFILGIDRSGETFAAASEQWDALQEKFIAATEAAGTFENEMSRLADRARVFPEAFDTAVERLEAMRDAALEFAGLPDDIAQEIAARVSAGRVAAHRPAGRDAVAPRRARRSAAEAPARGGAPTPQRYADTRGSCYSPRPPRSIASSAARPFTGARGRPFRCWSRKRLTRSSSR